MADPLVDELNALSPGHLPGLLGFRIVEASRQELRSRLDVRPDLLAPNGFLHAATVVALADTTCGYGTRLHLPQGATGFTTIELKTNFLGTVREGAITCRATVVHAGRTTQVWDAVVSEAVRESGGGVQDEGASQAVSESAGEGGGALSAAAGGQGAGGRAADRPAGRTLALFRCTQAVLWPRPSAGSAT